MLEKEYCKAKKILQEAIGLKKGKSLAG